MPFVEVFSTGVPAGVRSSVEEHLVREVMAAEGAPDTEVARDISWLVWHRVDGWSVGGRCPGPGEGPRYLVRVTVPAGSMDDGKRAEMVERVTRVLAEAEGGDRVLREPVAWVHVVELPEGTWGALGRVVRFPDIAGYVLTGSLG